MKIAFSWDDGAPEDQKLFELHDKYKIPGMFFVPTRNREGRGVLRPAAMREAESEYVAFGGHTENHTYLTQIPIDAVVSEVKGNKDYLEYELGHKVEHFCLPGGQYNRKILDIAYRYYRTVRTADTMNFHYVEGPLKPSFHFYPRGSRSLLGNGIRNRSYRQAAYILRYYRSDYFDLIRMIVDREVRNEDETIVIWGHSWELEKYNLWTKLEELMQSEIVQEKKVPYAEIFAKDHGKIGI